MKTLEYYNESFSKKSKPQKFKKNLDDYEEKYYDPKSLKKQKGKKDYSKERQAKGQYYEYD